MRIVKFNAARRVAARLSGPAVLAAAFLLSNPTTVAMQDIASLLTGADAQQSRWQTYLVGSAAGSIQKAELVYNVDPTVTGSIASSGIDAPNIGRVVLTPAKSEAAATPDEQRINRAEKTGRIVSVAPVAPPKDFSAGRVLEQQSFILHPATDENTLMAFAKPRIGGKEIEIATEFHQRRDETGDSQVPVMLARLVTNKKADVLATAYAPSEPDFVSQSPFRSLLKEPEPEDQGRFIPPFEKGDHAWAQTPLPAEVFSAREQKCLAEGVYFEARGEKLEGQAAVAQVILNRVRNPAFPDTICGVVYQNDNWRNRCQFSFACDGKRDRVRSPRHWETAQDIAMAVSAGKIWLKSVGSATHYHAVYVRPRWARTMERKARIGLHVFYRPYGGGWS
ncbi:cell wall hydrolase [Oricola nitratireducens]|uniref:cell wall hydrolase n=1 Tax=Oricola nitratireducens TaxID=2775868 RepID=UPI0031BA6EFE